MFTYRCATASPPAGLAAPQPSLVPLTAQPRRHRMRNGNEYVCLPPHFFPRCVAAPALGGHQRQLLQRERQTRALNRALRSA